MVVSLQAAWSGQACWSLVATSLLLSFCCTLCASYSSVCGYRTATKRSSLCYCHVRNRLLACLCNLESMCSDCADAASASAVDTSRDTKLVSLPWQGNRIPKSTSPGTAECLGKQRGESSMKVEQDRPQLIVFPNPHLFPIPKNDMEIFECFITHGARCLGELRTGRKHCNLFYSYAADRIATLSACCAQFFPFRLRFVLLVDYIPPALHRLRCVMQKLLVVYFCVLPNWCAVIWTLWSGRALICVSVLRDTT